MVYLLSLMWKSIDFKHDCPLLEAGRVSDLMKLMDKYDVNQVVHSTYTLEIVKMMDCIHSRSDQHLDAFIYALRAEDQWLCGYVTYRWNMGDRARWDLVQAQLLGFESWHALIQVFHRMCLEATSSGWRIGIPQID